MLAPFTRSMTLTFGLCGAVLSPELLAESEPARNPDRSARTLELDATSVTAQAWAPPRKIPGPTPPAT